MLSRCRPLHLNHPARAAAPDKRSAGGLSGGEGGLLGLIGWRGGHTGGESPGASARMDKRSDSRTPGQSAKNAGETGCQPTAAVGGRDGHTEHGTRRGRGAGQCGAVQQAVSPLGRRKNKKETAQARNRTGGSTMATLNFTTKPLARIT